MNPGKTIKVLRTTASISQKEFASRLDISPSYLSLIEGGEREPSVSLLRQASRLLGVPVSVFYFQADDSPASMTPSQQAEHHLAKQALDDVFQRLFTSRED